jgi:nucleotide-binding universal stress UspA family protein
MYPYSLTRPIVVAVDGSSHSDAAVKWAADESVLRNAPVKLVHAVAPMLEPMGRPGPMPEMHRWYHDNARTVLFESEALFRARRDDSRNIDVEAALVESSVVSAVIKASEGAQLIVVGSRGLGHLSRLLLGSVSTILIHHAHCPVAVIPHPDEREGTDRHPVLLGIDGSTASEAATGLAFDEASRRGVGLTALHAWSDVGVPLPVINDWWYDLQTEAHEQLAQRLAGWQEKYPDVHVDRRVVCDVPAHALVAESRVSQLVIIGSHGRGGFTGMPLGSVGAAVAHASDTPVIVVRD